MLTIKIGLLLTIASLVTGIVCGVMAENTSVSPRRAKLKLALVVLVGSALWMMQAIYLIERFTAPRFHISGVILKTPEYTSARSHRTQVLVQIDSSTQAGLNTEDHRPGYRAGEHIDAEYEGNTGDIISARFTSANGSPDGEDHRVIWIMPGIIFLLGGYMIASGVQ